MITFRHVMRKWLYDEDRGYYYNSLKNNKVGLEGDFYTSTSLSKFFGGSIARYILRLLDEKKLMLPLNIVEIGSNRGHLISDIAEFLFAFNGDIFSKFNFYTIEPNENLAQIQKQTFQKRINAHFSTLNDIKDLKKINLNYFKKNDTFFIANELFDSFPCDLVVDDKILYMSKDLSRFEFIKINECKNNDLRRYIQHYDIKSHEVSIDLVDFFKDLRDLDHSLDGVKFVFICIDYGDFVARDMNLRLYRNHEVFNFFELLKSGEISQLYQEADITYDIDFSLVGKIAKEYNFRVDFCKTQGNFLIQDCEILDIYEIFSKRFNKMQTIRHLSNIQNLILPDKMGERFKVISISNV